MESILQDINAVIGVTGSFVCDKEGTLVARALPSVFDEAMLLPAVRTLLQSIEGLETTRRRKVNEFDLVFQEGRLVVKNLREGCLCILCVRNINVPLLNLTANVGARKLSKMLKEKQPTVPEAPAVSAEEETVVVEAIAEEATTLLLDRAMQLITTAQERGIILRLLGGMAVKVRCPGAASITSPPEALDLDFAIHGTHRRQIGEVMEGLGYEAHTRFNALQGSRRLKFSEPKEGGISIDMFVDSLHMCHKLDFSNRLHLHGFTLPLADLLMSKLQIVQMNEKDLRDVYAILYDHDLDGEADPEKVDAGFVVSLCSDDWGWYKTVTLNIEKTIDLADDFLAAQEKEVYVSRARQLSQMIEAAPKSLRWQARARIGEARRWYDLPEAPPSPSIDGGFFAQLSDEFAEVMGPLGPVIIDNEIAALGETRESFPRDRLPELVERLSPRIEDQDKRARFKEIMLDVLGGPK
jgi:predicted regulator of Ras-like GTPase activity (Roadblock/LC7/MglB family)